MQLDGTSSRQFADHFLNMELTAQTREYARTILAELMVAAEKVAAEKTDYENTSRLVTKFQESVTDSTESFCNILGIDQRTFKRWSSPADKKTPPIPKLRTWTRLFRLDKNDTDSSVISDLLPRKSNEDIGIYSADDIKEKIGDAKRIYTLKSRSAFHAASNSESLDLIVTKLREPAFEARYAWIKPDLDNDPGLVLPEFRSAKTAPESFVQLKEHVRKAFANAPKDDLAKMPLAAEASNDNPKNPLERLYCYELTYEEAATCGLADGPFSLLVIEYNDSARGDKYMRRIDVFYEIPVAFFDEKRMITNNSLTRWVQVEPTLALKYYNNVWPLNHYKAMNEPEYMAMKQSLHADMEKRMGHADRNKEERLKRLQALHKTV